MSTEHAPFMLIVEPYEGPEAPESDIQAPSARAVIRTSLRQEAIA
jgi:hypothetical protein